MAKGPFFRRLGCLAARRFPAACLSPSSQRQWQCPVLGPDGNPSSPRVCACEAQPRTPHPTGLGYPAPAKLSLCPTSVTPLEAPLIGQDAIRIREVRGTGISVPQDSKNLMLMNENSFVVPAEAGLIRHVADVSDSVLVGPPHAHLARQRLRVPACAGTAR